VRGWRETLQTGSQRCPESQVNSLAHRDTTEGVLIVVLTFRKARQGGGLGRAGEHEAWGRKAVRHVSFPSVLEPARRCPR